MVFSLIQIFRKKTHGKAIFVLASLILIAFQFMVTGPIPLVKYVLEILMVLIIAPIRIKKKLKLKGGKLQLETIEQPEEPTEKQEVEAKLPEKTPEA